VAEVLVLLLTALVPIFAILAAVYVVVRFAIRHEHRRHDR